MKGRNARTLSRATVVIAVLGAGALVALALFVRAYVPHHNWLFSGHYALGFGDLLTRKRDIFHIHHGSNVYSLHDHHQYFTYPPAALFLFWPLSWANFHVDVLVWTLVSLAALAGSLAVVWRVARPSAPWVIAAGAVWGTLAAVVVFPVLSIGLALGQVGLMIMFALTVDELALRGRGRGVLTGVATAIKIYPGLLIVAWLWRRQWRPAMTAVASAAFTTVAAWIVWPTFTRTFVARQLFSGREMTHFLHSAHWRATSSSPYAIFFRWPFHGGPYASLAGWLASALVVALGLWASYRLWQAGARASALVMILAASVLAGPVTWDHYYTFAPLLIFVALENRGRRPLAVAAIVAAVLYAVPWQLARNESLSVTGLSLRSLLILVARNAESAAAVLLFVVAIVATRSVGQSVEQSRAPLAQVEVAVGGGATESHDDGVESR